MASRQIKSDLHPLNLHRFGYDFEALCTASPDLAKYIIINKHDESTAIPFDNPLAVKELNRALLTLHYGIRYWDLPSGYLCPPIPGRADYILYLADLLFTNTPKEASPKVKILDIGTGANCIYPLIGTSLYNWNFTASEIDKKALGFARQMVSLNDLGQKINLRHQPDVRSIFKNIIRTGEIYDACMCNPPFHASLQDVYTASERKWKNLRKSPDSSLNFGGHANELYYEGGESRFLSTMIDESAQYATSFKWFTSLVSKKENIKACTAMLNRVGASTIKFIDMAQGQKKSRILAWNFQES